MDFDGTTRSMLLEKANLITRIFAIIYYSTLMNFLAHVFLSGNDEEIIVGNFIADFVKGKKKDEYPQQIKRGIELHRMIDDFTDHHPVVLRSQSRIRHHQGRYSGVVIDLFFDHFLAKNFSEYHPDSLKSFSEQTYSVLKRHWHVLPIGVHLFLPFMIGRNWLLNYSTIEGIDRTLKGISRRVSFENKMNEAVEDLRENYSELETDFKEFFAELIKFVQFKLK